jgi:hypothetical protein
MKMHEETQIKFNYATLEMDITLAKKHWGEVCSSLLLRVKYLIFFIYLLYIAIEFLLWTRRGGKKKKKVETFYLNLQNRVVM